MKTLVAFSVVFALMAGGPVAARPGAGQQRAGQQPPSRTAPASPTIAPAPTPADPKARLLYQMARWQWRQKKGSKLLPQFDSSSVEKFRLSVRRADPDNNPAGILTLYTKAEEALRAQRLTYDTATPDEVRAALATALTAKYRNDPKQAEAAAFVATLAAAPVPTAAAAPPDAAQKADSPQTSASTSAPALAAEKSNEGGEEQPQISATADNDHLPGVVYFLAGLLIGLLAGAASFRLWQAPRIRAAVEQEAADLIREATIQIESLKKQISNLKRPTEAEALTPLPLSSRRAEPIVTPPSPAASEIVAEMPATPIELSVAPAAPPAPTRYYAPAPDVPYIEHRKLSAEPLTMMPVRLVVDGGPAGTRATYGFSPEADQARIINDGVRNLRAFFDFELPASDQISTITTRRAGRLERVGERWEVREKAQLDIQ